MTIPLWCLVGFVGWTLMLLTGIAAARVAQVVSGTTQPNGFPSGVPHGSDRYWRLNRAHLNCVENLPLFGAVVLIATVAGIRSETLDLLARLYLAARIAQSCVHISSGSVMAVNLRFGCYLTQVGCIVGFLVVIGRS